MAWQEEMVGAGRLVAHCGGRILGRAELVGLHTPTGTETWKPVPHSKLVDALVDGLHANDIKIRAERYCVSGRGDARFFGVLDLEIPGLATPEYNLVLGIRGANDQSLAISAVVGAHVFVCDNTGFSGESGTVVLKRKHTSRLDLTKVVPPAIDAYLEKAHQFVLSIEDMKGCELSEADAKGLIYDAFARDPVMDRRMFPTIDALYFRDEAQRAMFPERTLWSLNNSFTQAIKPLSPVAQDRVGRSIGRFFARVVNKGKSPKLGWDAPADDEEVVDSIDGSTQWVIPRQDPAELLD